MGQMCVSLRRVPVEGPGEGGPSNGNFENSLKEGSGCGAPVSMGALLEEAGEGLFCWGF
jgi:hypothetical protein